MTDIQLNATAVKDAFRSAGECPARGLAGFTQAVQRWAGQNEWDGQVVIDESETATTDTPEAQQVWDYGVRNAVGYSTYGSISHIRKTSNPGDADHEYCVECGERIPEGAATSTE